MNKSDRTGTFSEIWERLVAANVSDEESAYVGRLFNIYMLITIIVVSSIAFLFVMAWVLGLYPAHLLSMSLPFPLFFIPFSLFCIALVKRGLIRPTMLLFVWVNFIAIALSIALFDGPHGGGWVLFTGVIYVAGTLLSPTYGLRLGLLVVGYYVILEVLSRLGLYFPPIVTPIEARSFLTTTFTLTMLVWSVGLFTYLNVRDMRETMKRLRETARELDKHRHTLEQQVAQRTADLARHTSQLEAAATVAREAAEIRDLDTLLNETVRLISERFGFYHAGIFLVDEAGEYAVLRAASSEGGKRMLARGHRLAVGKVGIVGTVAGTGKPRIALDVGADAVFFSNPDLPYTRSEMALPLKVGERVIGVLDVQSVEPSAFTNEDVAVLQTMADQIALAIENARLLSEVQDRLREVEALSREYARREWGRMVSERPGWGYVYDGVEVKPKERASDSPEVVSALTIPMQLASGETIGRVALAPPDRPFTDEEVALAQTVAEQAALALESARLFRETQRALRETEVLYRAIQGINMARTPGEILDAFVENVVPPQMGRCVLALLDPSTPRDNPVVEIVAAWEPGVERPAVLGNRWSISQIPLIAQMPREPLFVSDTATSPVLDALSRHVFREMLGIQAFAAIPLVTSERHLGWLLVESLVGPYEFSETEKRLYSLLGGQIALALERMRLFEETRRRAEWERIRAEVSARVRISTDIDTILRTAVRELGRAFRAAEGVIQLHSGDGSDEVPL